MNWRVGFGGNPSCTYIRVYNKILYKVLDPDIVNRLRQEAEEAQRAYQLAAAAFGELGPDSAAHDELREKVRQTKQRLEAAKERLRKALEDEEFEPEPEEQSGPDFGYAPPLQENDRPTHRYNPDTQSQDTAGAFRFEAAGRNAVDAAKDLYGKRDQFWDDIKSILLPEKTPDPDRPLRRVLFLSGLVLFLLPLGALIGFRIAYNRLNLLAKEVPPTLSGQPRAVYAMMVFCAALGPVLVIGVVLVALLLHALFGHSGNEVFLMVVGYLILQGFLTWIVLQVFSSWQSHHYYLLHEMRRHGTARFAKNEELLPFTASASIAAHGSAGFFIGGGYYYGKSGHLLTVAGTRAGKGVNLIVPNLLRPGGFNGSWVIIDPKGENAAITAEYQRSLGKRVVMLNPWEMLALGNDNYNPLDLLKGDRLNLVDDVQLIAETLVPVSANGGKNSDSGEHFTSRARTIISGLILHLVTTGLDQQPPEPSEEGKPVFGLDPDEKHLGTVWKWLRLPEDDWGELVIQMAANAHPTAGEVVVAAANDIITMMDHGRKEFTSIMSTAQRYTDFLKSPAMQDSVRITEGGFRSADLADGQTVVYVVIPADRLKTHASWLRLVVCALMRSVVRNPQKDVCFLLDEFYALGYLSEVEIALGSYAGYGIHIWAILQNLIQLQDTYGTNWENFISSCAVRHFFNISDNMTAEYVAKMFGQTSVPSYSQKGMVNGATGRYLVAPDELRRFSGETIYGLIDQLAPVRFEKWPYFKMDLTEGQDYAPNPYYKG